MVPGKAPDLDVTARTDLARDVDQAIAEADLLADRRDVESDRLARDAEIERRLDQADKAMQALDTEEAHLATRRVTHNENWQAVWRAAGVTPGAPADMVNWLNAVASLIADQEALDADAAKIDALVMREMALAPSVEALATELAIQAQGLPVALAIREIDAAIESIADTWLRLREAGRDLEKARGALAGVAKAEQRLGEETEHWCTAWRESMPAIGLRPEATEEEAEAALAVWSDVPAQRNKRTTALHRADQMTLTLDIRRTEVAALVDRVASDLAATDHIMAIGVLRDRLRPGRPRRRRGRSRTNENGSTHGSKRPNGAA